jgi:hypothetical protein
MTCSAFHIQDVLTLHFMPAVTSVLYIVDKNGNKKNEENLTNIYQLFDLTSFMVYIFIMFGDGS